MSNHTSESRAACPKPLNSLELWRSFADSVPDMVLLVAADGTIQYVNSPPEGVSRNAIVGMCIFDFAAPEARAELTEALAGIFRDGTSHTRTQRAIHPDGSEHWY